MAERIIEINGITFKIFSLSDTEILKLDGYSNKGRSLVGTNTYDTLKYHNPTGEYHIHRSDNGHEILEINKVSGTALVGYHGVRTPNKSFKELMPDWNWPNNQMLESLRYTCILDEKSKDYLRPVNVYRQNSFALRDVDSFNGFIHQFDEERFLTGVNGGWKERNTALVETEDGYIRTIPEDCF